MSANLCCFHFLTRTRKKVEVAPAIENKADQKIPIQSESQITEQQAITTPPPPIEEIRTTTEIITNAVPINNIIKVIETQPQVSQTINIVTYQQKTESSDIKPQTPLIPRSPKRRFSLFLVPIAQAVPQTVIKLGIKTNDHSYFVWSLQDFNSISDKYQGWEIAPLSDIKSDEGPIWPKNLKRGPIAPFELSDTEDFEYDEKHLKTPEIKRKGSDLSKDFDQIFSKVRRSKSEGSLDIGPRPTSATHSVDLNMEKVSVKSQGSLSIDDQDRPWTAQSEDRPSIPTVKYSINYF